MDTTRIETLLKLLEAVRDQYVTLDYGTTKEKELFAMQMNIFTSNFFFAVTELKGADVTSLSNSYITYFKSRYAPTRYLFESLLTFLHFVSLSKDQRTIDSYGFFLSGKLHIHKLDLSLNQIATKTNSPLPGIAEKLEVNRNGYRLMLQENGKIDPRLPDEIDNYFNGINLLNNLENTFGFKLFNHSKINYINEILNNKHIPDEVRDLLLVQYPLLSLDAHPTPASLIDFELFIKKDITGKSNIVSGRNEASEALLYLVGSLMKKTAEELLTEL